MLNSVDYESQKVKLDYLITCTDKIKRELTSITYICSELKLDRGSLFQEFEWNTHQFIKKIQEKIQIQRRESLKEKQKHDEEEFYKEQLQRS